MLADALAYAARGWPVLPLWWPTGPGRCACGAADCSSPGKHPHGRHAPHGLADATLDAELLERWWAATPDLNVGLRTGITFDVLDLDGPDAGRWLADHAHRLGVDTSECWGWGPLSATAHGHHLLYAPTGAGNRSRVAGVAGFDWRGRNGYVVAPPSVHECGHVYAWHPDCGPDAPIPEAPGLLVDLVRPRPDLVPAPWRGQTVVPRTQVPGRRGWSPSGLVARVATAADGERNTTLNWAANRVGLDVRRGAVDEGAAGSALEALALAASRAGLGDTEVGRTIVSGFRAGAEGRGA